MKLILTCIFFLSFFIITKAQDLIYLNTKSIIECTVDTTTFNSELISYTRYDMEGNFQINKAKILFIKDFKGEILFPKEVVGVESSKHIHWQNTKHYAKEGKLVVFPSIKAGISAGYSPCLACFNFDSLLPDQQIENLLTQQTLIYTRINWEILYEDKRLEHVQQILTMVLNNWPEEKKGYNYRLQIYKGIPNAYAVPGGYLFISDGLLDLVESDLELATVLAHEVAHVEKRHSLRRWQNIQNQKAIGLFVTYVLATLATASGEGKSAESIFSLGNSITEAVIEIRENGYSQEYEEEADILALLYFQKQSLPLTPMKSYWDKMANYYLTRGSNLSYSYGTHPSTFNRIDQIERTQTIIFEQPVVFECKENANVDKAKIKIKETAHFFNLVITTMNIMPSSTEDNTVQVSLLGYFLNEPNSNTYRIKRITISSKENDLDVSLYGCDNFIIPRFSDKEYFLKFTIGLQQAKILEPLIKSRTGFELKIELERITVERKGKDPVYTFTNIPLVTKIK